MKPEILLFFALLLTIPSYGEVLKFDVSAYKRELHKYQDVCKEMGIKHLLLVEPIDLLHLDCMGNKVSIKKFCLKKLTEQKKERFLRGYINKKLGEVVCEMGDEALVSIGCDKRDKHFCKEPAQGCVRLKEVYAYAHQVDYHSFIKKDVDNVLNCYFSLPLHMKEAKAKEVTDPLPFEEDPVIDKDIYEFDRNPKSYLKKLKRP